MDSRNPQVAVALSGGVDSAVAAALLRQQGLDCLGVHLRLSSFGPSSARLHELAQVLGIPLLEIDLRQDFQMQVVDYFLAEYRRGRTPNPCVRCNAAIKFGRLWDHLRPRGITHLATGHYARLSPGADGAPGLFRGSDRRKDQSYFLHRLPRELLSQILFPLAALTKAEVRRRYREWGLPPLDEGLESMELCFIPGGRTQEYLSRHGNSGPHGDLVDTRGRVLGRHRGIAHYTVGQRRGLGVPAREPYYVTAIHPEANRVVLGHQAELFSAGLLATDVNWLIDPPAGELEATAVIRYRHQGVAARIIPGKAGRCGTGETPVLPGMTPQHSAATVIFHSPQAAVAPGQAVVFFQGDRVLGGGWIEQKIN